MLWLCDAFTAYCSEFDWHYPFGLLRKGGFSEEEGVRFCGLLLLCIGGERKSMVLLTNEG
jgi:hypothetical protein